MMDRSILGPSMCAGTAVWQCRETAGSGGGEENVAAGDRNHLPPHQTPYFGVASKRGRIETIKSPNSANSSTINIS